MFLPTFVKEDKFEVNQYEMNSNIFYYPKNLPFLYGNSDITIYDNEILGPYNDIKPVNAKITIHILYPLGL